MHFLVPQALRNVGFIPLSSNSALAARTVRDNRPEINNSFSTVRHATVFEGVKTATTTGESIQKIISAPILCDEKVVGVMQISRKGPRFDAVFLTELRGEFFQAILPARREHEIRFSFRQLMRESGADSGARASDQRPLIPPRMIHCALSPGEERITGTY